MKLSTTFATLTALAHLQIASACSPVPGWRPPTVASALANSEVVIYARVDSKQLYDLGQVTKARVTVLKVIKGRFEGEQVITAGGSLCGIGTFQVGEHYVFFFSRAGNWFVSHLEQPRNATTDEILRDTQVAPR